MPKKHSQEQNNKSIEKLTDDIFQAAKNKYVMVNKINIRSWKAILIIGLVAGFAAGVVLVANRSGEFERGFASQGAQKNENQEVKYVPGELIVKVRSGFGEIKNTAKKSSLHKLNIKHGVISIERVFKSLEKSGRSKKGNSVIKAAESLASTKAKYPKRAVRAPKDIKIPDLENIHLLKFRKGTNILFIADEYSQDPNVEYAEPNYIVKVQFVPNDPYYSLSGSWGQPYDDLWGLKASQMNMELAWDITRGEGVVVAVVDSGVDYNHEDINTNIWSNTDEGIGDSNGDGCSGVCGVDDDGDGIIDEDPWGYLPGSRGYDPRDDDENGYIDDMRGWNFVMFNNDPMDDNGHGTHVAGTIAAIGDNNIGIVGVAPKAKIMAIKALDQNGEGNLNAMSEALKYATDNGADVINNSWVGFGKSQTIQLAVDYALSSGAVVVAAAGNNYGLDVSNIFPANIDGVIAVAATDENDEKCSFSNWGHGIDVAAPGCGSQYNPAILSLLSSNATDPNINNINNIVGFNYVRLNGTSMATPYVSGLAALLVSEYPNDISEAIGLRMKVSTDPFNQDYQGMMGSGRINTYDALTAEPRPYLEIQGVALEELEGDGDRIPESGEKIKLIVKMRNIWENASSVTATLSTNSGSVTSIINSSSNFGSIAQDGVKDNTDNPFIFQIGDINYVEPVRFTFTINADGFNQSLTYEVLLGAREIVKSSASTNSTGIDGNKIVWGDNRSGNWDIYLYDLETNTETQITSNLIDQRRPDISGNKIVWSDKRDGKMDVYLYDINTNTETKISSGFQALVSNQYTPKISGNKIVWSDNRAFGGGNKTNIYLYDIDTDTETQITSGSYRQYGPDISGNKIVWYDDRNGNWDIYLYDLDTNTETKIISDYNYNFSPAISGNKVVYTSSNDPNDSSKRISLYDLDTNTEIHISSELGINQWAKSPDISGNKIVWSDTRKVNDWDVYLYDLDTNTETQVFLRSDMQYGPSISGNKIVWYNWHKDGSSIYLTNTPPLTIPLTQGINSFSLNKSTDLSACDLVDSNSDIQYVQNGQGQVYFSGSPFNTLPCTPIKPYDGYVIQTLRNTFLNIETTSGVISQDLSADLKEGWNLIGFENITSSFDSQLNNLCATFVVSDANQIEISPTQAPELNKAYYVHCGSGVVLPTTPVVTDQGESVSLTSMLLGDLNYDGVVDETDVDLCIDLWAGGSYQREADINGNGEIDDWDLLGIIGMAAGSQPLITISVADLSASWSSPDSGIAEYQYAIGVSRGATDIVEWTSAGTNTSVTKTGLSLTSGTTYYFSVKAISDAGLESEVGYSDGIIAVEAQTPWQDNAHGFERTDLKWNYTLGYHFTPTKNGIVTKLGGFFSGAKIVKLWDKDTGEQLAETTVTASNNFSYEDITPVAVKAGKNYTVAVYIAGNGGSYRYVRPGGSFPQTYGDITIKGTTYASGARRPVNNNTSYMYGQADIEFVPGD